MGREAGVLAPESRTALPAALVWGEQLAAYRFPAGHPLDPRRLQLTVSLIQALDLLAEGGHVVPPRQATEAEVLLVHDPEYVRAVKRLSAPGADAREGVAFGLGTQDTPVVEGMHDAARWVVGATLRAAELVMSGRVPRAFSIAGGLHHAARARGGGFCIYNDLAVAIRWIQRELGARVMYVDYDAHHAEGVQEIFYDDPDVLTVSFHESGAFLYPGTGFVKELGTGDGYGSAVNVPLEPETQDESWLHAFEELVPPLAQAFRPDLIVLQNGCDGHILDPLTHLRATTGLFEKLVRIVCDVADRHCDGRVVATGGGGYAIHAVVPRAWTLVWAALRDMEAPMHAPAEWLRAVREESGVAVPAELRDPPGLFPDGPRKSEIDAINARTVKEVRHRVLPLVTGWGLAF